MINELYTEVHLQNEQMKIWMTPDSEGYGKCIERPKKHDSKLLLSIFQVHASLNWVPTLNHISYASCQEWTVQQLVI